MVDRMTYTAYGDANYVDGDKIVSTTSDNGDVICYGDAIDRLAAYEDIGPVEQCAAVVRCGECVKYMSELCVLGPGKAFMEMGFCCAGQRREAETALQTK